MPRKRKCPKKTKKKGRKKPGRWLAAVKREYRKNKKAGLAAAMKRAKKHYKK